MSTPSQSVSVNSSYPCRLIAADVPVTLLSERPRAVAEPRLPPKPHAMYEWKDLGGNAPIQAPVHSLGRPGQVGMPAWVQEYPDSVHRHTSA